MAHPAARPRGRLDGDCARGRRPTLAGARHVVPALGACAARERPDAGAGRRAAALAGHVGRARAVVVRRRARPGTRSHRQRAGADPDAAGRGDGGAADPRAGGLPCGHQRRAADRSRARGGASGAAGTASGSGEQAVLVDVEGHGREEFGREEPGRRDMAAKGSPRASTSRAQSAGSPAFTRCGSIRGPRSRCARCRQVRSRRRAGRRRRGRPRAQGRQGAVAGAARQWAGLRAVALSQPADRRQSWRGCRCRRSASTISVGSRRANGNCGLCQRPRGRSRSAAATRRWRWRMPSRSMRSRSMVPAAPNSASPGRGRPRSSPNDMVRDLAQGWFRALTALAEHARAPDGGRLHAERPAAACADAGRDRRARAAVSAQSTTSGRSRRCRRACSSTRTTTRRRPTSIRSSWRSASPARSTTRP